MSHVWEKLEMHVGKCEGRRLRDRHIATGLWLLLRGGIIQSVPCNCDHFLIYYAPYLSSNHSRFIHQSSLFWLQQRYLVAKRRETGREMTTEFYLSYLKGSLTYRKILRHGADGFTFPPKEIALRIFIVLKNPSLSAGFEPTNLGFNGKHDDHYTTEND
jgi:hypothetical protein